VRRWDPAPRKPICVLEWPSDRLEHVEGASIVLECAALYIVGMHSETLERWKHSHAFGTEAPASGERRARWVIALTFAMMVVEIATGSAFGSMALLADGFHMATHAAALGIAAFAYAYARRNATSSRFSFGTGKVGALGGFGSAVALAVVSLMVLVESGQRFVTPVHIDLDEAIAVAAVGLIVNLLSAVMLRDEHEHDHEHGHAADAHLHRDHNLRAAYLHVVADALTSVLAIGALTAGKLFGWLWLDPAMGIVGSLLIARWSLGLIRDTSRVLLDAELTDADRLQIQKLIESNDDNRVTDLHLWRVGPRHLAAIVSVVTHVPKAPAHYKALLGARKDLAHVTIEVERCPGDPCAVVHDHAF
jgi:cation diffusion facilitator family transporter